MVLGRLRRSRVSVENTGLATAGPGAIAVSGSTGPITMVQVGPVVRSGYLEQVRSIAPPMLEGREGELARLVAFCTEPQGRPYVWWRAAAWSGKSALMSWFVLHPPVGVRVLSFFITARYAGQSDRTAFTEVLLEQLAELLGEPMPAFLTEATRSGHLLDMLTRAAHACHDRGQRLVLVVDGLDEDRGVTVGPDAHSIAALLPAQPPADMRVIVAGRPNPPIPSDVPDDHPLKDPGIVVTLARSAVAQVIRQDKERELERLLYGSPAEQDLLGLVVAAGGGLSGPNLAELTDQPVREITKRLRAVSGRTFTPRAAYWQPNTAPQVYVLAHEELQNTAADYLGDTRLDGYRQRLHAWAEDYRQQGWPAGTPEYLLRGYYRLLHATDDRQRMLACATDQARHDRMLDITGGDAAALTEITIARDAVLTQPDPDLHAMARLAIHRDHLTERNSNIPTELPAVWAMLGHLTRGEALARSITNPYQQAKALAALAKAVASTGDLDRAEDLARSLTDPDIQTWALAAVAEAVASAGEVDRARGLADRVEALARSITDPNRQGRALAYLVKAVASTGDIDRAEALVGSITDPFWRGCALAYLAKAAGAAGDIDRAEALARSITNPEEPARTMADLAKTVAAAGDVNRAEALARSITDPHWQAQTLGDLAKTLANAGNVDRARVLTDRAHVLANQAEALARSITNPEQQAQALAYLVEMVASTGDIDRAVALVGSITDPFWQGYTLAYLAKAAGAAGDIDRAEALAWSITNPEEQARALAYLVEAVASTGDIDRAVALARSVTNPYWQARALTAVAQVSEPVRARRLIAEILHEGRWTLPLYALAQVEPLILTTISEEFLKLTV